MDFRNFRQKTHLGAKVSSAAVTEGRGDAAAVEGVFEPVRECARAPRRSVGAHIQDSTVRRSPSSRAHHLTRTPPPQLPTPNTRDRVIIILYTVSHNLHLLFHHRHLVFASRWSSRGASAPKRRTTMCVNVTKY